MRIQTLILMIVASIFVACDKDDQVVEISDVDVALQPYFQSFIGEANARGITIEAEFYDIEARIEEIGEGNVVGQCWYGGHGSNEVLLDKEYWLRASTLDREFVVFHELGHCYLDRGHNEASTTQGTCVSIMASGTGECRSRYSQSTREQYIDELFFGQ